MTSWTRLSLFLALSASLLPSAGCSDSSSNGNNDGRADASADASPASATWVRDKTPEARADTLWGCFAASATELYAVGTRGTILRSTGDGTWAPEQAEPGDDLLAVWGVDGAAGPLRLAVGRDRIVSRDRATGAWKTIRKIANEQYRGIWGAAAEAIYVVSDYPLSVASVIRSVDGGATWERVELPKTVRPRSIWGSGPSDIYLVTNEGLYHSVGAELTPLAGAPSGVERVWGRNRDDVWLVGNEDAVFHSIDAGKTWAARPTGITYELGNTVKPLFWALTGDATRTYVGGSLVASTTDRGTTWTEEVSPHTVNQINCTATSPDGKVTFAVGGFGNVVLRREPR